MSEINLNDAQKELINSPGNVFFEACPGGGKTTAIVLRYYKLVKENPYKGIGLLSFSKAAIEEVQKRCHDLPEALKAPNFIGTFDSFINKFIVKPIFISKMNIVPDFVETWEETGVKNIFAPAPDNRNSGFCIDWFDFDDQGRATLNHKKIVGSKSYLLTPAAARHVNLLANNAKQKRQNLVERGLLSSAESRRQMHSYINEPTGIGLVKLLANRFSEIIIDEAQDCSLEELELLAKLKEEGVSIILVADLNQAIYEFRDAVPQKVRDFVRENGLTQGSRLSFNYRSTPSICALIASLRLNNQADNAANTERVAEDCPVYLMPFSSTNVVLGKIHGMNLAGITHKDIIVLAHRTRVAEECSGTYRSSEDIGTNNIVNIAYSSLALHNPNSSAKAKMQSISKVERIILGCFEGITDMEKSVDIISETMNINRRWLRRAALFISLTINPTQFDRRVYTGKVQHAFNSLNLPEDKLLKTVTTYLTTPAESQWNKLNITGESGQEKISYSTIHAVKGQEFNAVVLVIERNLILDENNFTVLDHWENKTDHESKRVLYVGASRARKKLILAIHDNHHERIKQILTRDGVSFTSIN